MKCARMLRWFFLLAVMGGLFMGCFGAPQYSGPTTAHFDGERFYNAASFVDPSFFDVLKWKISGKARAWPAWIDIPEQPAPPKEIETGVRITYVNHATVLIQFPGMTILTDPVWSERVSPLSWTGPKRHKRPGISFDGLPKIDVVLLSHNHYDHLDIPTLQRLYHRDKPVMLAGLGTRLLLESYQISNARDLDWWQSEEIAGVRIGFAPAQHWSARSLGDKCVNLWGSFYIKGEERSVYFAGDTGVGPHFAQVTARYGPPDVALIPIGAYEPRWFMHPQHLDPAEAVEAHLALGAQKSLAIHWGTFSLADDGPDEPVQDLAVAIKAKGLPEGAFVALENGRHFFY